MSYGFTEQQFMMATPHKLLHTHVEALTLTMKAIKYKRPGCSPVKIHAKHHAEGPRA